MRNRNIKHSSCASRLACQEGFRQHSFAHEKRIPCKSQAHFQAQGISWYFHSISMYSFHKWLTHLRIRTSILIYSHEFSPQATSHCEPLLMFVSSTKEYVTSKARFRMEMSASFKQSLDMAGDVS